MWVYVELIQCYLFSMENWSCAVILFSLYKCSSSFVGSYLRGSNHIYIFSQDFKLYLPFFLGLQIIFAFL